MSTITPTLYLRNFQVRMFRITLVNFALTLRIRTNQSHTQEPVQTDYYAMETTEEPYFSNYLANSMKRTGFIITIISHAELPVVPLHAFQAETFFSHCTFLSIVLLAEDRIY